MKRTGPLRRKTALDPFAKGMSRAALRSLGARGRREAKAGTAFRDAVLARAGGRYGRCERCGRDCSLGDYRLEAHHRHPKSHAPMSYRHDPGRNGAALCVRLGNADRTGCHDRVHDHRAEDWAKWVGRDAVRSAQEIHAPPQSP